MAKQPGDSIELWSGVPEDLAEAIATEYGEDDLRRLAAEAVAVAINEIKPAYRNPFVEQAARGAVSRALGLKPLYEHEGEQ